MTREESIVRFEDVSLHYGEVRALDHVSFRMGPGETRVVAGAAGSGKTVLLKTAVGLIKPDSGRVYLLGHDITDLEERDLYQIRGEVGILFQEGALFDSLSVQENVSYPLENRVNGDYGNEHAKLAPEEVAERVRESLRFVELEHTVDKFPSELSGGMRRRVGIARAIVTSPPLALYDSPTAGLDPITANLIVDLIIKERDLRNTATILVTHRFQDGHMLANFRYNPDSGEIEPAARGGGQKMPLSTRFLVMKEGRIIFEGTEAELTAQTDPYIRRFGTPGSA